MIHKARLEGNREKEIRPFIGMVNADELNIEGLLFPSESLMLTHATLEGWVTADETIWKTILHLEGKGDSLSCSQVGWNEVYSPAARKPIRLPHNLFSSAALGPLISDAKFY